MTWVVDTCVVIDLVERDGEFSAVSSAALTSKLDDSFVIAPITYVELAPVVAPITNPFAIPSTPAIFTERTSS